MDEPEDSSDTASATYTQRLMHAESAAWKRWVNAQAPYRWNLRRLEPGFVLDIGCGLGRNLLHLGGNGVGVDHNAQSVRVCRRRGLEAYIASEFQALSNRCLLAFDSLLLSHVVEHMPFDEARSLLHRHLDLLRPGGQVILITPQECGYRADPTHVEFYDFDGLGRLATSLGLEVKRVYSFPFPRRPFGSLFRYNEFVLVAGKDG